MKFRTSLLLVLLVILLSVFTNSLPEAIGGLIAATIAIIVTMAWRNFRRFQGFNVRFSSDSLFFGKRNTPRKHQTIWECKIGERELLLRIMPNKGTHFGIIGVWFVNKRKLTSPWSKEVETRSLFDRCKPRFHIWEAADNSIIRVEKIEDIDVVLVGDKIEQKFAYWEDGIRRVWGRYNPPYHRSKDDSLWIRIKFKAEQEWEGYIQFVGHVSDDERGYNRLKIKVSKSPNNDMSDFVAFNPKMVISQSTLDKGDSQPK